LFLPRIPTTSPCVVNFALDRLTDSGIDNLQLVATGVPAKRSNGQSLVCWHFPGAVDVHMERSVVAVADI